MTYEEAIYELTNCVIENCNDCDGKSEIGCDTKCDSLVALDIAIECIKKQMPKPKRKVDYSGKCGSCKYAMHTNKYFGGSPCYIVCQKPGKVFRTDLAHVKQRTTKACKGYERKENETSEEAEKA